MRRLYGQFLLCALALLSGCSPAFNWREVGVGNPRLLATDVFSALKIAAEVNADVEETFFSGLRFR